MDDPAALNAALRQHYGGSETVYKHSLNASFCYTPGVREFFQSAGSGAYWLSDILATEPAIRNGVTTHGFCVMVLRAREGKAMLTVAVDYNEDAEEGHKLDQIQYTRAIDLTDCPDGDWKFYLTWARVGGKPVMLAMLPREH